ncbi:PD-(D/E)XK nuclease family protein [bacterium]|nr:PD-(D/E)XK nuclease family protein [bacterium]
MLKELIDQFYLDQEKNRQRTHFYITDAGKCPRAIFFKFKQAPQEKMEPRILRVFDNGNYVHRFILRPLFSLGLVRASEISTPPHELVSGRADAILTIDNELYVLDVKSMVSTIFRKMNQPKTENLYQIQLYLHFFKIKKGILLYVNKDNQDLKEFLVNYDKQLCENILKDLRLLREKIDQNIIPLPLSDKPYNWQCRYCQFKTICNLAGKKEIKWDDFQKQIKKKENY